jgi:hypothetical protein
MKKENIKINVLAFLVCYCSSDCFSMDFSNNQQLVEAGPPSILSPYYVVQADIGGNIIFVQTNPNKRNRRRISLLPTEQKAIKI